VGKTPAIYIQAGAFADPENARRLKAELVRFGAASTAQTKIDDRLIYRVRVGPLATVDDADALRDRLVAAGYSDARLVID
jgi:rare lipoprotein A